MIEEILSIVIGRPSVFLNICPLTENLPIHMCFAFVLTLNEVGVCPFLNTFADIRNVFLA